MVGHGGMLSEARGPDVAVPTHRKVPAASGAVRQVLSFGALAVLLLFRNVDAPG